MFDNNAPSQYNDGLWWSIIAICKQISGLLVVNDEHSSMMADDGSWWYCSGSYLLVDDG